MAIKLSRMEWPRTSFAIYTNVLNSLQVIILFKRIWLHGPYFPHTAFKIEEEIIIW